MFSLEQPMGWDCLLLGLSLAKVAIATIAYCLGKRTKIIAAFRYRGCIDIFCFIIGFSIAKKYKKSSPATHHVGAWGGEQI
jgi:hypothetical protein